MKMNQHEKIVKYMQDFGKITPMDAFLDLGITKLATRVSELIRDGMPIIKEPMSGKNRYGEPVRYTQYRIGR